MINLNSQKIKTARLTLKRVPKFCPPSRVASRWRSYLDTVTDVDLVGVDGTLSETSVR